MVISRWRPAKYDLKENGDFVLRCDDECPECKRKKCGVCEDVPNELCVTIVGGVQTGGCFICDVVDMPLVPDESDECEFIANQDTPYTCLNTGVVFQVRIDDGKLKAQAFGGPFCPGQVDWEEITIDNCEDEVTLPYESGSGTLDGPFGVNQQDLLVKFSCPLLCDTCERTSGMPAVLEANFDELPIVDGVCILRPLVNMTIDQIGGPESCLYRVPPAEGWVAGEIIFEVDFANGRVDAIATGGPTCTGEARWESVAIEPDECNTFDVTLPWTTGYGLLGSPEYFGDKPLKLRVREGAASAAPPISPLDQLQLEQARDDDELDQLQRMLEQARDDDERRMIEEQIRRIDERNE